MFRSFGFLVVLLFGNGQLIAADGKLVMLEDTGNAPHNGKVWFYDPATGTLRVGQQPLRRAFAVEDEGEAMAAAPASIAAPLTLNGPRMRLIASTMCAGPTIQPSRRAARPWIFENVRVITHEVRALVGDGKTEGAGKVSEVRDTLAIAHPGYWEVAP